jgi:hypothetical protein
MTEDANTTYSPLVEYFRGAYAMLLAEAKAAMKDAEEHPEAADSFALQGWQVKALPLLEQRGADIEAAVAQFAQGDPQLILRQAQSVRGLGKNLTDAVSLQVAGPEHEKKLSDLLTMVAVTAYRLCEAAGMS